MKKLSIDEEKVMYLRNEQYEVTEKEIVDIEKLEQAVLSENVNEVKTILDNSNIVFLSRALGFACALGNIEIVKLLVEKGASFNYEYNRSLDKELLGAYRTNQDIYIPQFEILLTRNGIDVSFSPINVAQSRIFLGEKTARMDMNYASEEKRKVIVEYLLEKNHQVQMNLSEMLFLFLINGLLDISQAMIEKGVTLSNECIESLSNTRLDAIRGEWMSTLAVLPVDKCLGSLKIFSDIMRLSGQQIVITNSMMTMSSQNVYGKIFKDGFSWSNIKGHNSFQEKEVLEYLFESTDVSKIKINDLINVFIEKDDVFGVSLLFEYGGINKAKQIDKYIDKAQAGKKIAVLSWLLDYKNKTVDTVKELQKAEKKMLRELSEKPDSVSAIKKIWTTKNIDEGAIQINGYKGFDRKIVIPSLIGKKCVVAIGEDAFSPWAIRIDSSLASVREKITVVEIPETVKHIDKHAFRGCKKINLFKIKGELDSIDFLSCLVSTKKNITVQINSTSNLKQKLFDYNEAHIDLGGVIVEII